MQARRARSEPKASEIESLEQATAYLEGLINVEHLPSFAKARLGLAPIRALLECLGHPERELSIFHVAGSKGKGSTCLLAESIVLAGGRPVGTFTSPHLMSWTERFRVSGKPATGALVAAAVDRVRPFVDELRLDSPDDAPSFFDATTAAALWLFADAGLEHAILEVGLGGRLDSTNAVDPQVTCITSIEREHTEKLGDTLAAIAGEKAGILKPGVAAVAGRLPDEAEQVVRARAADVGAPLAWLGVDFEAEVEGEPKSGRTTLRYRDSDGFECRAHLAVLGRHQVDNAALAIAAVRRWTDVASDRLPEAIASGLASAALPGRIELLGEQPWVIVDAAHTEASARALAGVLTSLAVPPGHLVLSISGGKDLDAILGALLPHAARITVTRAEPHRSLDPAEIAAASRALEPGVHVSVLPDPRLAVRAAREGLGPDDSMCVAGSVYLAGVAREVLLGDRAEAVVVSRRNA